MAKSEGLIGGEARLIGADEIFSHQRDQIGLHRCFPELTGEVENSTSVESSAFDGSELKHPSLAWRKAVKSRLEPGLDRRGYRKSREIRKLIGCARTTWLA